MITFEATVSGDKIGSELVDDPEECASVLIQLAGMGDVDFDMLDDAIDNLTKDEKFKIKAFLLNLGNGIEV